MTGIIKTGGNISFQNKYYKMIYLESDNCWNAWFLLNISNDYEFIKIEMFTYHVKNKIQFRFFKTTTH